MSIGEFFQWSPTPRASAPRSRSAHIEDDWEPPYEPTRRPRRHIRPPERFHPDTDIRRSAYDVPDDVLLPSRDVSMPGNDRIEGGDVMPPRDEGVSMHGNSLIDDQLPGDEMPPRDEGVSMRGNDLNDGQLPGEVMPSREDFTSMPSNDRIDEQLPGDVMTPRDEGVSMPGNDRTDDQLPGDEMPRHKHVPRRKHGQGPVPEARLMSAPALIDLGGLETRAGRPIVVMLTKQRAKAGRPRKPTRDADKNHPLVWVHDWHVLNRDL